MKLQGANLTAELLTLKWQGQQVHVSVPNNVTWEDIFMLIVEIVDKRKEVRYGTDYYAKQNWNTEGGR